MNEEFINVYIDFMNKKIEELTRTEVMLQTRLAIAEKLIASFKSENDSLRSENDKNSGKKPVKNKEADIAKENEF